MIFYLSLSSWHEFALPLHDNSSTAADISSTRFCQPFPTAATATRLCLVLHAPRNRTISGDSPSFHLRRRPLHERRPGPVACRRSRSSPGIGSRPSPVNNSPDSTGGSAAVVCVVQMRRRHERCPERKKAQ